mmetsp:Transcript_12908/g.42221  ORF Transcript_12908/g.42221 Transcript_12908/m.42221 type:complete len:353 (+) Transcript_12908:1515-2573(+)
MLRLPWSARRVPPCVGCSFPASPAHSPPAPSWASVGGIVRSNKTRPSSSICLASTNATASTISDGSGLHSTPLGGAKLPRELASSPPRPLPRGPLAPTALAAGCDAADEGVGTAMALLASSAAACCSNTRSTACAVASVAPPPPARAPAGPPPGDGAVAASLATSFHPLAVACRLWDARSVALRVAAASSSESKSLSYSSSSSLPVPRPTPACAAAPAPASPAEPSPLGEPSSSRRVGSSVASPSLASIACTHDSWKKATAADSASIGGGAVGSTSSPPSRSGEDSRPCRPSCLLASGSGGPASLPGAGRIPADWPRPRDQPAPRPAERPRDAGREPISLAWACVDTRAAPP